LHHRRRRGGARASGLRRRGELDRSGDRQGSGETGAGDRLRGRQSQNGPRPPGDKVAATVTILGSGIQTGSLEVTGHIALLELEGCFVKFADGILDLEISRGVIVHVRVRAQTFMLPSFATTAVWENTSAGTGESGGGED
jgi:hypothetical protein